MTIVSWPAWAWGEWDPQTKGPIEKCVHKDQLVETDGDGIFFTSCCTDEGLGIRRDCSNTPRTGANLESAISQCESQGGRLCTADEVVAVEEVRGRRTTATQGCSVDGPRAATGADLNRHWTSTPCTPPYELCSVEVVTGSETHAETSTGANVQFMVDGTWSAALSFGNDIAKNAVVSQTTDFATRPTAIRLVAGGDNAWGYKRVDATCNGERWRLLDSENGEPYTGDTRFWVDGNQDAPPMQEFAIPNCASNPRADGCAQPLVGFDFVGFGVCREADGGTGRYSKATLVSLDECASLCSANAGCFGIEYIEINGDGSFRGNCEMHRQLVPNVALNDRGLCYGKH